MHRRQLIDAHHDGLAQHDGVSLRALLVARLADDRGALGNAGAGLASVAFQQQTVGVRVFLSR